MFCIQSLSVFTFVMLCCRATTLTIKSGNSSEHSTLQKVRKGQATLSNFAFLNNGSSTWTHSKTDASSNNHPTRRQTIMSPDVDESYFDSIDDPVEEYNVNTKDESRPSARQDIIEPSIVDALRLPHPYPFHNLNVHWDPPLDSTRIIPRPLHVHHYRGVPVAVRVPKYEHYPEPYYFPYKPNPDYNVMHVHVYEPGLYVQSCSVIILALVPFTRGKVILYPSLLLYLPFVSFKIEI